MWLQYDFGEIPEGSALLLYREEEAIVQLTLWWKRPDEDQLHEFQEWSMVFEWITA